MSRFLSAIRHIVSRRMPVGSRASSKLSILVTRKKDPEPVRRYEPGGYHPVNAGEVYNQHYQVVRQLGWGLYSTVWLVQDIRDQRLAAMKVLVGDLTNEKGSWDELGMLRVLRDRNPQSSGHRHVCQLLDDFVHQGPNGTHICLVLEAMGPSVLDIYRGFPGAMPLFLVKRVSKHVLRALHYMHEECGIIHTDLKGDNILMAGTPPEIGQENIQLGMDDLTSATFKLTDFGASNKMSNRFAQVIQPQALRSPEVIIGAEWDTKADIWNFGCLMYEFARGAQLFDPHWNNEESAMNPPQTHLAQMVGLFGEFPPKFLKKGANAKGYFDDEGRLLRGAGQYSITLEDLLHRADHPPEEIRKVVDFLSLMLIINPEERWSAAQLLDHPWLKNIE